MSETRPLRLAANSGVPSAAVSSVSTDGLAKGFLRSVDRYPARVALVVENSSVSYRALYQVAANIARCIVNYDSDGSRLTAVLASRSLTAYAGVLGSLLAGNGYVPLNPSFPVERNAVMLERATCRSLVIGVEALGLLAGLLDRVSLPLLIVMPECTDTQDYQERWSQHTFVVNSAASFGSSSKLETPAVNSGAIAYLLFTSGTTGSPKGVGVTHSNVRSFVEWAVDHYGVTPDDRFSQTFDLTFDLSVFDMFAAWEMGAAVCVPSRKALLNPRNFIREQQLTIWFSVPSLTLLMKQLGSLDPGYYPSLRLSLFCGEALPRDLLALWAKAAPNSCIENLYGPTEATVACMAYRWDKGSSVGECEHGIVPIGYPLPKVEAIVVDDHLSEVPAGEKGELLLSGCQVTPGYWRDPDKTAAAFIVPPGRDRIYYRTGDYVRRPSGGRPMVFLGRLDNQVKVQGYRVELQEVEAVLRQAANVETAVAVAWPLTASGAAGIEAFVKVAALDVENVLDCLAARLPRYSVPRRIHLIKSWPLNANGKIDRKQLVEQLEAEG